ncbi:nucleotidyltransferase family protein [Rhodoferax sp. PAMC 29310]|uniref:nucleotidyltransferase domain-containing protein n=1 Tax=Rhodoferax sp. PAMC 29310 TaxID=2822760 RepID=UPI001F0B0E2A|nr:nucleotidyltransferase family protein [Rhodoferax sp. PAMC 29310]
MLGDPCSARQFDAEQWSALVNIARRTNLLGVLAERLNSAGVSAGPLANRHFEGARQLSERQHRSVLWEVHQLDAALGHLQIPILLLKGAAYVISGHVVGKGRLFGDIDILVPRASLGDVESRLMLAGWVSATTSAYDQRYYRKWMHELPPMTHLRRGTVLDVHHTILPLTARNAPDPKQIIDRSSYLPNFSMMRIPSPEDLVIHSITHLVHEGEMHNGLRDLNDIDCMLRRFSLVPGFWDRFVGCAVGNDLAGPVCFGLSLARRFFGTPIPSAVLTQLSSTGRGQQTTRWLEAVYVRAIEAAGEDHRSITMDLAKWLVYVRSHWLRMPWTLMIQHLSIKAWVRWRASVGSARES